MKFDPYIFQSKGDYPKHVFYVFLKNYMQILKYFFFGKVEMVGHRKIPIGNPVIYSSSHQNAFMDALLLGAASPMKMTSITRSDVFGNHAGKWFMDAVQMQPIYRMRDGYEKLGKNEEVFEKVRERLRANEGVLIFSEGNHGDEYYLRPLQKGSSRMAVESQEAMMEKDIYIVPVGLNYFHHQRPLHKLAIVYGDPIRVKDYLELFHEHPSRGINTLREDIAHGMRCCMLLPEKEEDYFEKKQLINRRNEGLDFERLKLKLSEKKELKYSGCSRPGLRLLGRALGLFNFLPLFLTQVLISKFRDIVFHCSLKWLMAIVLFPLWWMLMFTALLLMTGWKWALLGVIASWVMLYLRQWLIRISNVPHHTDGLD